MGDASHRATAPWAVARPLRPLAPWGWPWGTLLHSHNVLPAQDDVTAKCCNGGSETGHRRAQGNAENTCVLGACTPACAEVFLGMLEQCPDVGATVLQTPDWVAFAETCHAVADPPPPPIVDGRWISVAGHYLAADPGMTHSQDSDGTGASAALWSTSAAATPLPAMKIITNASDAFEQHARPWMPLPDVQPLPIPEPRPTSAPQPASHGRDAEERNDASKNEAPASPGPTTPETSADAASMPVVVYQLKVDEGIVSLLKYV